MPLSVLYYTFDYPQASEVYVDDEIRHVLAAGVRVAVWANAPAAHPEPLIPGVRLAIREPISQLIAEVKPDVLHLHWMSWSESTLDVATRHGLPITVRAHTDTTLERLQMYCAHPAVKRVYLYPMVKERFGFEHPKIAVCPIGVEAPQPYQPANRDRKLVLRAASTNARNQLMFIELAKALPDYHFRLMMSHCYHQTAPTNLAAIRQALAVPLENCRVDMNVSKIGMAQAYNRAGIYCFTFPEGKVANMPLSVAQALAAGCYVIAPNQPTLKAMIGPAGAVFNNFDEAVALIKATETWSDQRWSEVEALAKTQATPMLSHHAYADLVPFWQSLKGHA
jgi:glycosyltransferase involved in cell wall biosynthesis